MNPRHYNWNNREESEQYRMDWQRRMKDKNKTFATERRVSIANL